MVEGDSSFEFNVPPGSGTQGAWFVYGDFVAIDPRLTYRGSVSAKLVTGAGDFSAGYMAFDAAKAALAANGGGSASYFIASNSVLTIGNWTNFMGVVSGEGTGPTQFPVGTRFIRPIVVVNRDNIGITRVDAMRISPDHAIRTIARWQGYLPDDQDNGALSGRTVTLTKLVGGTGLRVTWCENFRVIGVNACQWEVLFNGASCPNPAPLIFSKQEALASQNDHDPSTVVGTCFGLPAGPVTISTKVGPVAGYAAAPNCYTGWIQTSSLEVEEVW